MKKFAATILVLFMMSCDMSLKIPMEPVKFSEIDDLQSDGFVHVGAQNIKEMQKMRRAGMCKSKAGLYKGNVCGFQAGESAGFLLSPREIFYDTTVRGPGDDLLGREMEEIRNIASKYPIIRPKKIPQNDAGTLPFTLAKFWSKHFKYHQAIHLGFENFEALTKKIKSEIHDGRPVMINIIMSSYSGLPLLLPEPHLGLRAFQGAHWVVVIGFSDQGEGTWLIKDNGALGSISDESNGLIKMSTDTFKKISNNILLGDDLKTYLSSPSLPVYLEDNEDPDDEGGIKQLKEDFRRFKKYNIVVFEEKR